VGVTTIKCGYMGIEFRVFTAVDFPAVNGFRTGLGWYYGTDQICG